MTDIDLEIDCSELSRSLILKAISIIQKTCNIIRKNILYQNLTTCDQLMIMTNYELEALRYMQTLMHSHTICHEFM